MKKLKTRTKRNKNRRFRLRRAVFKGRGLQPQLAGATWDQILDISYEGRGG